MGFIGPDCCIRTLSLLSGREKHANGGLQSPKTTFDGDKPKSDVALWDSFLLMKSSVYNGL